MAPVEPDFANTNTIPILTFTSQVASVGALLVYIFAKLRVASGSLPPSHETRSRTQQRRKDIAVLSSLGLLSISIVSYFALGSRTLSYQEWAQKSKEPVPNSLWSGWYGATEDGVGGLQLGRWFQDVNVHSDSYRFAVQKSRGFWWTQQQFTGLLGWSIFVGIEGRRRHLPKLLTFAFVLLAQLVGLSVAQNLFYIGLLLTPIPLSTSAQRSSLWTPHPAVFIAPLVTTLVLLDVLPSFVENSTAIQALMIGYFLIPQFFALGVHLAPVRFGTMHNESGTAHRSYTSVFYWFAIASFIMHGKHTVTALIDNTPESRYTAYYAVWSKLHTHERTTYERSRTALVRLLNAISDHPAVSVIGWDVLLSALSYSIWSVLRGIDVNEMLKCSAVPWLNLPADEEEDKAVKHVAFDDDTLDSISVGESTPPSSPVKRTRGRPRKTSNPVTPASPQGKKSTRSRRTHAHDSDSEDAFVPSSAKTNEIATTVHGEGLAEETLAEEAESAALSWGLFVLGGLGVVSAAVLGAEVRAR